jgi:hypothetical protein
LFLGFLLRRRKKRRRPIMAITATPPTEPPTMAPMGAGEDELVGVAGDVGDVGFAGTVWLCVLEVVGEGDGEEEVELDEGDEDDRAGWVNDSDFEVELGNPVNVDRVLPTSPT